MQIHTPHHATTLALSSKMTSDGKMAIAEALQGFNSLGHSVTPAFISRNRFYSKLSAHCPKMNKISMWEVKKIQDFCPRDITFCHLATARCTKLVAKLELVVQGTLDVPFENSLTTVLIGGFRSDLSITRKIDGNFGNVSAGVLFSKVTYQRKQW